jgi:NTE family protein
MHAPRENWRRAGLRLLAVLSVAGCTACAAPIQRTQKAAPLPERPEGPPATVRALTRPAVGVAFGGGSARGIAHVGVIRWFEEHRIPIDVAAGTSMGGLIGGAFAAGMDAPELQTFIGGLNWDQLFGASTFAHKNIRRKADARSYPSRLEFGTRGGIVPPAGLNNGEYVELLLGRIAAPYFDVQDFDELPTPFRTVAVDLLSAQPVVMRRGSLADAMRATMSLPMIFPPMEVDGQILIDGGTMNNVPADVVRQMGASRVVGINVGDLSDREGVNYTMLGVAGNSLDAMMRASTRRALQSADVVIDVPLKEYGSLDWRRAGALIEEGYKAAEAMRDTLLPFAVSAEEYEAYRTSRQSRRRTDLPVPAFVDTEGFAPNDAGRLKILLERHAGAPLDLDAVEKDIAIVAGLDRYETVTWRLMRDPSRGFGLHVKGRMKSFAPPFMMLGLNLENTTSDDFRFTLTGRYLAFDVLGSGSELRIDGTIGSDPGVALELYRPVGTTPLFVAPYAGIRTTTFNLVDGDAVIARYGQTHQRAGAGVGVNLGARSDVRLNAYIGRTDASISVGDPGFPEVGGKVTGADLVWRMDTQDRPVVPSTGVLSEVRLARVFNAADIATTADGFDNDRSLTQLSGTANSFWSRGPRNRLFAYGGLGTSFDTAPLPNEEFPLGSPFRLGSYGFGELRGRHYYIATGGYLRQVGRLPDFMGGPIFVGTWLENGDAFDEWSLAGLRTNGGAGIVMDTLIGPVIVAGSWGFDGRWRTYLGVGRIFR